MTAIAANLHLGARSLNALVKLNAMAGQALQFEWQRALRWRGTVLAFQHEVIAELESRRLVFCRRNVWTITDAGIKALGAMPDAPGGLPGQPALAHTPATPPLSSRYIPRYSELARAGSLDYRDIPSRIGEHLVSYSKD